MIQCCHGCVLHQHAQLIPVKTTTAVDQLIIKLQTSLGQAWLILAFQSFDNKE